MIATPARNPQWSIGWRLLVFVLAGTSLGCLLADFYGVCSMRAFAVAVFLPAMIGLAALAGFDLMRGNGQLGRPVAIGATAGLAAAVAYDLFRLPFVYAKAWGLASVVPPLQLFKVFPVFGAMLLGQSTAQASYPLSVSLLGWAYHFSNGITIGVMYLALIADPRQRHWSWAILLAMGLEIGMLLTPYPRVFGIPVTARFVAVTLAAHGLFGVCLGWGAHRLGRAGAPAGS